MKLPIVILSVLGLACGKSLPTRNLQDDLNDFLALVPVDQVLAITLDYLANDEEVQKAVEYIQGEEFRRLVTTVERLDEFGKFVLFLQDHGIDAVKILNDIHSILDWDPYVPPSLRKHLRRGVGINGLIDDIIRILPTEELKALFEEKLVTSPDFRALYDAIRSPEFQRIIETLKSLEEYKDLIERLKEKGVDVDHYIDLIKALFGLSRVTGTRSLQDDLNDFLALVPLDQVLTIALDYLANDPEVQEFVIYLQSPEFHNIVLTVEALPEFVNFIKFISDLGIDAVGLINQIHGILGLPPFTPTKNARRGVGINGLIDDVIAVLPIDDLRALFNEKLATSPDFKAFVEAIQSPEFSNIVSTLQAIPEYQKLLQSLRDKGVDVDHFIDLFRALFGLTRKGTRSLQDDLNDFLALVPLDQVLTIALDYLANDPEVQEFVIYLQSEEFHKIVLTVEALPEFVNFIKFISDLGIDAVGLINQIHGILGLPPFTPTKNARRGVGINGLIDDVIAVLPIDDLRALFNEKLATSPDFKAFVEAIQSPEFSNILSTLKAIPEYQELLQSLRDKGVDVDHFIDLFKALFGLTRH